MQNVTSRRVSRSVRTLVGALTAAVLAAAPTAAWAQGPGGMSARPVVVDEVTVQTVNMSETFVGTVMPLRRSTVGSQVEGRVEKFLVNEGDRVTMGQPLANLRTTTLRLQLKAAEAELELREAELTELEKSKPAEIEQAQFRMESAQAQMVFNDKRLTRFQELYERKALSDDELEEQVYAAEAAKKNYYQANSAWQLATSGIWDAKITQGQAKVDSQNEIIAQLKDEIEQHTIAAPFDGYVTREDTEEGEWVSKGGPIVEMVEVDQVDVETPVLERYEPQLRVGARARVEFEALPRPDWEGRVALIVPQADVRSRSFPVKVRIDNEVPSGDAGQSGAVIKPGMFARVVLPVGRKDAVTMVPKDALVLGTGKPLVWVIVPDQANPDQKTAVPVPVELGLSYDDLIEVHGALQAGQLVVVEGNERIQPGVPLAITKRPKKQNAEDRGRAEENAAP